MPALFHGRAEKAAVDNGNTELTDPIPKRGNVNEILEPAKADHRTIIGGRIIIPSDRRTINVRCRPTIVILQVYFLCL